MARQLRLEFPGACYHVWNRGNYRRDIFAPKGAAEAFERCLFEACARFGWGLHAFVVMRNHFHLAVETPEPNLSLGMKWLQGTWVARFNRLRGEKGRPFQGRFSAQHVEAGHALAQVALYVHLNPVEAGIVTPGRAGDFRPGSLNWFPRKGRPPCLRPGTILAEAGDLADTPRGWGQYREYLAAIATEEPGLRAARFKSLTRGWMVGSDEFRTALRKDLAALARRLDRVKLRGTGDPRALLEEIWADRLKEAARLLRVRLNDLPPAKSAEPKVRLAAFLKMTSSVANGWLAAHLGMGAPASVSQYVRRFRLRRGQDEARFKAALSTIKT
jgi:REP element-mobilizing transposase RayT